jgi:hypothetical protein
LAGFLPAIGISISFWPAEEAFFAGFFEAVVVSVDLVPPGTRGKAGGQAIGTP